MTFKNPPFWRIYSYKHTHTPECITEGFLKLMLNYVAGFIYSIALIVLLRIWRCITLLSTTLFESSASIRLCQFRPFLIHLIVIHSSNGYNIDILNVSFRFYRVRMPLPLRPEMVEAFTKVSLSWNMFFSCYTSTPFFCCFWFCHSTSTQLLPH